MAFSARETEYKTKINIPYYSDPADKIDEYTRERCVPDIYYPANIKDYAAIVWFHRGTDRRETGKKISGFTPADYFEGRLKEYRREKTFE